MTFRTRRFDLAAGPARTLRDRFGRRRTRGPWWTTECPVDATDEPGRRSPKAARVEAALLVADTPLSARKLVQFAKLLDAAEARQLVDDLNDAYDADGTAFRIEWVAAGFQLLTRPVYAPWLQKLHERRSRVKLSPSALETVVVVAYRQPVTRADVDAIRGVRSAELLRQLMERGLIRIVGEEDSLGRPYLYGTTKLFLEEFGLRTLDDLPRSDELRRRPSQEETSDATETDEPQTASIETASIETEFDPDESLDEDDV